MKARGRSFIRALLTLTGTIMGAGIFGLPAVFGRLGILWGSVVFWTLALLICGVHLLFAEIYLKTERKQRLSGYVHRYLGSFWGRISSITYPFQIIGANLLYILLGGEFLGVLMGYAHIYLPVTDWQIIFWFVAACLVLFGLKLVARVEAFAVWLLVGMMLLVSVLAFCTSLHVQRPTIPVWNWSDLSIGIILFSLSGLPIIGETVDLVGRDRKRALRVVAFGSLMAALLSWLFGVSLALASSGEIISQAGDFVLALPAVWAWVIPTVGFLAIATSYITTATDLMNTWYLDFGWAKHRAWIAALFPPIILLFLVQQNFLFLMDAVGSVFTGLNAAFVCMMALAIFFQTKRKRDWIWHFAFPALAFIIFGLAIFQKFFYYSH